MTKKRQSKNYGVRDISSWTFEGLRLPEKWINHLGELPEGARILIEGDPKNGKTEYTLQFMNALCSNDYKVTFNSTEQLKTKGLFQAFVRNKMDVFPGKFMICDKSQRVFEIWFERLCKPNSGHIIVLDSADYMNLTFKQYQQLHERFPTKTIIIVCWKINPIIKSLKHMQDVIVEVKNYVAKPVSRLGGNTDLIIWDKKGKKAQQTLF